jgi:8-oxo-dGTP pyrophosphatase MutT (NUDIX family)
MIETLRERLLEQPGEVDLSLPQSAVLVLLDQLNGMPSVLLTQRSKHLRLHAGEVAFPGGRCDPEDPHPWATAVREAEEEVGLSPALVEPLGFMEAVVTRTGIQVIPCVGMLTETAELVPNPDEIESVFEVPVNFFAEPEQLHLDDFVYGERIRGVPRYEYEGYTIWGITAAIMVQLVNLAFDAKLDLEDYWKGASS